MAEDTRRLRQLMSVPELADLLQISVKSVREHVRAGHIPSLKVGHLRRFDPATIERWIVEQQRPAHGTVRAAKGAAKRHLKNRGLAVP